MDKQDVASIGFGAAAFYAIGFSHGMYLFACYPVESAALAWQLSRVGASRTLVQNGVPDIIIARLT